MDRTLSKSSTLKISMVTKSFSACDPDGPKSLFAIGMCGTSVKLISYFSKKGSENKTPTSANNFSPIFCPACTTSLGNMLSPFFTREPTLNSLIVFASLACNFLSTPSASKPSQAHPRVATSWQSTQKGPRGWPFLLQQPHAVLPGDLIF